MRIQLRLLFVLLAVAAVIFSWLANRDTARFRASLIQYVPSQGDRPFEDEFYEKTLAKLKQDYSEIYRKMQHPEKEIRDAVRIEVSDKASTSQLITVNAWGNPLTGDDTELKEVYGCAIEALHDMGGPGPGQRKVKLLNIPKLP
ncbi:MAG: hypothetical protein ACE361_20285 [Aureliella sp.]